MKPIYYLSQHTPDTGASVASSSVCITSHKEKKTHVAFYGLEAVPVTLAVCFPPLYWDNGKTRGGPEEIMMCGGLPAIASTLGFLAVKAKRERQGLLMGGLSSTEMLSESCLVLTV